MFELVYITLVVIFHVSVEGLLSKGIERHFEAQTVFSERISCTGELMIFYTYQMNYSHLEVNLSNQYGLHPGSFGHSDLGELFLARKQRLKLMKSRFFFKKQYYIILKSKCVFQGPIV